MNSKSIEYFLLLIADGIAADVQIQHRRRIKRRTYEFFKQRGQ